MEKIVFSDTDYFYKKFQELVYTTDVLEIITDFTSPAQMPEPGKRMLRIGSGRAGRRGKKKTGPVLKKNYQILVTHDIYKRIRIVIIKNGHLF
ncbi:MAG: hypothetical protein U9P10_08525 [Thermodesulfobacteriota bacterium]|nr:hypothetical protein [Thermodesulfobacteriota bacterium]